MTAPRPMLEAPTYPVTSARKASPKTAFSYAAVRRFDFWPDYYSAVDEEFRYDTERVPWPVECDAAGAGIDNDRWASPEQVRILFLPHGFALDRSRDGDVGNLVACGMAWQPPVTLLAERVPYAIAKQLLSRRPGTLTGVIEVLRTASGETSG